MYEKIGEMLEIVIVSIIPFCIIELSYKIVCIDDCAIIYTGYYAKVLIDFHVLLHIVNKKINWINLNL